MGRIDEGSELWMDGDLKQRDKIIFDKSQGLERMIESLQDEELFGYINMPKSERSAVASLADKLD
jgi:PhoH-like ATPase